MKNALIASFFLLFLVGCQQSESNFMWVKKELTEMPEEEAERLWKKDIKECQYQVEVESHKMYQDKDGIPNPLIIAEVKPKLFNMCMEAKGYHKVPTGTPREDW
jgi:hypothetical protein